MKSGRSAACECEMAATEVRRTPRNQAAPAARRMGKASVMRGIARQAGRLGKRGVTGHTRGGRRSLPVAQPLILQHPACRMVFEW